MAMKPIVKMAAQDDGTKAAAAKRAQLDKQQAAMQAAQRASVNKQITDAKQLTANDLASRKAITERAAQQQQQQAAQQRSAEIARLKANNIPFTIGNGMPPPGMGGGMPPPPMGSRPPPIYSNTPPPMGSTPPPIGDMQLPAGMQGALQEAAAKINAGSPALGKMGGMGFKKGGSVKASKMGAVKQSKPSMGSASKRGDGIAQRGKTKGRMI